ncbi:MAG: hypothetical protein O9294_13820 [Cytophagales bacterium]|jgi:hypothetical protein|nr:hypothetical protein [Cytophagales bacterium]
MRIVSYNVENLFNRAKAFSEDQQTATKNIKQVAIGHSKNMLVTSKRQ